MAMVNSRETHVEYEDIKCRKYTVKIGAWLEDRSLRQKSVLSSLIFMIFLGRLVIEKEVPQKVTLEKLCLCNKTIVANYYRICNLRYQNV